MITEGEKTIKTDRKQEGESEAMQTDRNKNTQIEVCKDTEKCMCRHIDR